MNMDDGSKIQILGPVVRSKKGTQKDVLKSISVEGVIRVRVYGNIYNLRDIPDLEKNKKLLFFPRLFSQLKMV